MARARTQPKRDRAQGSNKDMAQKEPASKEEVNHPDHYGGEDNPYEVIKIIEYFGLGFHIGNTLKYLLRAGKKDGEDYLVALKKAHWYLGRRIELLEEEN